MLKVSEVMTANPVCVGLDDPLKRVKSLFDVHRFHHLLVTDEGKLTGVISDRDVLRWISPHIDSNRVTVNDRSTLDIPVHRVVTRHPITIGPEEAALSAVSIFNQHRISCIPVVDAQGQPLGIVSWRDILRHLHDLAPDLGAHHHSSPPPSSQARSPAP